MKVRLAVLMVAASLVLPAAAFAKSGDAAKGRPEPKVAVCHNTSSAKNPVVVIVIDQSAVPTHLNLHGDKLAIEGECRSDDDGGEEPNCDVIPAPPECPAGSKVSRATATGAMPAAVR
jgi:hypothetical protein